jgi:glucose dehydrogenase
VAKVHDPGPRRTPLRDLEGQEQRLAAGGAAMWVTGSYDIATNQVLWGTGNPVPMLDPYYRPGDNLYTNSLISWDPLREAQSMRTPMHLKPHRDV